MKVSVIIPVYNVEKYLRECLDSIVNQTLREIEIICVDDGSTDGSPAILAEYAAQDPRVKVITRSHTNAGAARNRGMDAAGGEYLFFCDADDKMSAVYIDCLASMADETTADVVVAAYKVLERGKTIVNLLPARLTKALRERPNAIGAGLFLDARVSLWNKLFRRSVIKAAGVRFEEVKQNNDVLFVCLALAHSGKTVAVNRAGYVYRKGRCGGITDSSDDVLYFAAVFMRVREALSSDGLYETARLAFANLVLAHCYYHLLGEFDGDRFSRLYVSLHTHLLRDLGLADAKEDDILVSKHFAYLRATLSDETPLTLLTVLLRERYDAWRESSARSASLQQASDEIKRVTAECAANARAADELRKELDNRIDELRRVEAESRSLKNELNRIRTSMAFRIGAFVMKPFFFVRHV